LVGRRRAPVPWKAKSPVDLRREFIRRLAENERLTDLCREYGISRKTGDKYKKRFEQLGAAGLIDQSRAPKVIPHKMPPEVEELVVAERVHHPSWGPKKLKAVLERRLSTTLPSASAIGGVLARRGLVQPRRRRRRHELAPTTLRVAEAPNDIWCIDYKGQFRLGDRTYCYPLTLTDQHSRYVLGCEGMPAISDEEAREVCGEVFALYGLPTAMRSDNGAPFSSTGLGGLTKLSIYWLRLGIQLERIRPAHPEENGQHERMHRTLKFETARPARTNLLQQQERFDEFRHEFNQVRPHEALGMKCPAEAYTPSPRPLPMRLPEPTYIGFDDVLTVNRSGQVYIAGVGQVVLSATLAGEPVGIREQVDGRWLVNFCGLDLGHAGPAKKMFTPMAAALVAQTATASA
jgi:transposase InsO family protein